MSGYALNAPDPRDVAVICERPPPFRAKRASDDMNMEKAA